MSDPIPEDQAWLIEKIEAFGYQAPSLEGLCFGIANMAMQSFLADNDMTVFNKRLKFLNKLSVEDIKGYKNEPVNTVVKIKSKDNSLLDLQAFLDGVMLYQEPENYIDITSSRHQQERAASAIVTPAKLDTDTKRPVLLNNIYGAYSKEELITYLNLLQQSIDVPAAFLLQSSNHGINLNFNPKNREWFLIDANELPARKFSDPEQLAVAIIDAFDATRDTTDHAVFKTTVFTRTSDAKRLQTSLDGMMNHSSWKEIHQINEHKATITDAFNANLLLLAASHGNEDIILQSINAGVDVNGVRKEDGVTPLYLAAQNGHLGAVVRLIDEAHAAVNLSSEKGVTPIYQASQKGHAGIVQKLIEAGASVNQESYRKKKEFPLYIAAQSGHQDVVHLLLEAGAEVNKVRKKGFFPLFIASRFGHLSIVKELMQSGAEIDQRNDYDESPLYIAAFYGHTEVVRELIDAGAKVNTMNKGGATPLFAAAQNGHAEVVRLLLEKNANPDLKANDKLSPLGIAAQQGHIAVVEMLLKDGADINAVDGMNRTPLFAAAVNEHAEIARLLLQQEGVNIDRGIKYGFSPLAMAIMNGSYPIVEQLLKAGADVNLIFGDGSSPLTIAISKGNPRIVAALLNAGADVNHVMKVMEGCELFLMSDLQGKRPSEHNKVYIEKQEVNGSWVLKYKTLDRSGNVTEGLIKKEDIPHIDWELLHNDNLESFETYMAYIFNITSARGHSSVKNGNSILGMAVQQNREDIVRLLLSKNADINYQTSQGFTPLSLAAKKGSSEMVRLLLAKNAKLDLADDKGHTPLFMAVYGKHIDVARQLLQAGAAVNISNMKGHTPLLLAVHFRNIELVRLLLESGAHVNTSGVSPLFLAAQNGYDEIVAELLTAKDTDVNRSCPVAGETPLLIATQNGHTTVVTQLIEKGADVNQAGLKGGIPLFAAVQTGNIEIVQSLLTAGADVNCTEQNMDATALMLAAQNGDIGMVCLLLRSGADISKVSKDGRTAISFAEQNGHSEITKILQLATTQFKPSVGGFFDKKQSHSIESATKQLKRGLSDEETLKDPINDAKRNRVR